MDLMNQIEELQKRIMDNKRNKGFNVTNIGTELLLLTEEVGEIIRAFRREEGKERVAEEAVDVLMYCLSILAMLEVDAYEEIVKKIEKNEAREYKKVSAEGWGIGEK